MGRHSKLPSWLEAIGARRLIEEAEMSGFIYYTRYFRSPTGVVPLYRTALQTYFHSFSLLTLPGDTDTWSVTVFITSNDRALKKLRDPERWTALVAACPLHAHWLDGEPITDVLPMGGILDRYRRFVVDDVPVATGIVSVGDADLFRAAVEIRSLLALPQEVMTQPGVVDRIMEVAAAHEAVTPSGPSREELLRMLA